MRQISLDLLESSVLRIATMAGNAVMDVYLSSGTHDVKEIMTNQIKTHESPVTQADFASHQIISSELALLTPDIPIVSEEDSASWAYRRPENLFWLIDPLDGTKEFISKRDEFTINIALVESGVPIFGVVSAPALNATYWGGRALGAFYRQGEQRKIIHANNKINWGKDPIRVLASKSHMNAETSQFIENLPTYELLQAGSSLKFCKIADGTADCYPRLGPTCEWDTAAAQAVLEAAGGCVSTLEGSRLLYGKPDVLNPYFVASSKACHDEIMNLNQLAHI